jgi:CrcB protein
VLDGAVRARHHGAFPWGTFAVNVLGSLIIGVVAGWVLFGGAAADGAADGATLGAVGVATGSGHATGAVEHWRLALATGLCGGFTTFSTAMVETVRLGRSSRLRLALATAIGTLAATVTAAAAGIALAGAIAGVLGR